MSLTILAGFGAQVGSIVASIVVVVGRESWLVLAGIDTGGVGEGMSDW